MKSCSVFKSAFREDVIKILLFQYYKVVLEQREKTQWHIVGPHYHRQTACIKHKPNPDPELNLTKDKGTVTRKYMVGS